MSSIIRYFGVLESKLDQIIVRLLPRYTNGVEGGVFLQSAWAKRRGEASPLFKRINNAVFLAPTWKMFLAITPLYNVVTGYPPVERLDMGQASALAFTGFVWAMYSLMVFPRSYALCGVNLMLFGSNSYNIYRRWKYEQNKKLMV